MYTIKTYKGFSLIELLIAVAIITMTISITSVIYSNYVHNVQKVNARSTLYSELLEVSDSIRKYISLEQLKKGNFDNNSVKCYWEVIDTVTSKGFSADIETGKKITGGEKLNLHTAKVICSHDSKEISPFSLKVLEIISSQSDSLQ